jgi:hypothetical protein
MDTKARAVEIVNGQYGYHEGNIVDYDYAVEMVEQALKEKNIPTFVKGMTKTEFLQSENEIIKMISELRYQMKKNEDDYKNELLERNGYKIGDVLTYKENGIVEKGVITGVQRINGDNSFRLTFNKIKKDGTPSKMPNDVMAWKYKLKEL